MTELRVIDAEPLGSGIVEKLEGLLTKARAGELSSVAVAVVYRDGSIDRLWSDAPSCSLLLGSVARLAHHLNLSMDA